MNFRPWEFFKQRPAGEEDGDGGGGGQGESTSFDTDFQDSDADAAAIAEGQAAIDADGDENSESETEEQSDEDQVQDEEEEEELEPAAERSFKDPKTGNWDWQKITKAIGSPELEKTFRETQAHITRVSQENATYREQLAVLPQLQQRAALIDQLDQAFHTNPEFRAAATKALGFGTQSHGEQDFELPPGVNPQDPLVPLIVRQQRMLDQFAHQQRLSQQERQANETKATFLQGLRDAKAAFESHVGREPTEAELRSVAQKMQQTRHFAGQDWIPSLFVKEIQEKVRADLSASRTSKRNLPLKGRTGAKGSTGTQKSTDLRTAFEEEWGS